MVSEPIDVTLCPGGGVLELTKPEIARTYFTCKALDLNEEGLFNRRIGATHKLLGSDSDICFGSQEYIAAYRAHGLHNVPGIEGPPKLILEFVMPLVDVQGLLRWNDILVLFSARLRRLLNPESSVPRTEGEA